MSKPREFWLTGEPNEYDVGVWWDHHPGCDVIYGKEFHKHHVIEYSAYSAQKELLEECEKEITDLIIDMPLKLRPRLHTLVAKLRAAMGEDGKE